MITISLVFFIVKNKDRIKLNQLDFTSLQDFKITRENLMTFEKNYTKIYPRIYIDGYLSFFLFLNLIVNFVK